MKTKLYRKISATYLVRLAILSLITLLILELALRVFAPQENQSIHLHRMVNEFRGWPEYVGTHSRKNNSIIIINNSKGNTSEIKDNKGLYSAQLQKLIRKKGLKENIENWSVSGLTSSQIEVLLVTAASLDVKEVVLILSASNLDHISKFKLNNHHADIDLLIGRPKSWPLLKHTYSLSNLESNSIVLRYLTLNSRVFRFRQSIEDYLALNLNRKYFKTLFGRQLFKKSPALPDSHFKDFAPEQKKIIHKKTITSGASWHKSLMANQKISLDKIFNTIDSLRVNTGLKTTIVFEPMRPWHNDEVELGFSKFFDEQCSTQTQTSCLNWTQLLTEDYFYNYSLGSHYDIRGHKVMSESLFKELF